jgi:hypothetical protein
LQEQNKKLSQTELAYFAGYFDGEGCVSFNAKKYMLQVRIGSADREVLAKFHSAFGGNFAASSRQIGKRFMFSWGLYNNKAQEFLIQVLPFLAAKRSVALLGLQITFGAKFVRLSAEEKLLRQNVEQELHAINQRTDAWI